jgi:hypothetical protein
MQHGFDWTRQAAGEGIERYRTGLAQPSSTKLAFARQSIMENQPDCAERQGKVYEGQEQLREIIHPRSNGNTRQPKRGKLYPPCDQAINPATSIYTFFLHTNLLND